MFPKPNADNNSRLTLMSSFSKEQNTVAFYTNNFWLEAPIMFVLLWLTFTNVPFTTSILHVLGQSILLGLINASSMNAFLRANSLEEKIIFYLLNIVSFDGLFFGWAFSKANALSNKIKHQEKIWLFLDFFYPINKYFLEEKHPFSSKDHLTKRELFFFCGFISFQSFIVCCLISNSCNSFLLLSVSGITINKLKNIFVQKTLPSFMFKMGQYCLTNSIFYDYYKNLVFPQEKFRNQNEINTFFSQISFLSNVTLPFSYGLLVINETSLFLHEKGLFDGIEIEGLYFSNTVESPNSEVFSFGKPNIPGFQIKNLSLLKQPVKNLFSHELDIIIDYSVSVGVPVKDFWATNTLLVLPLSNDYSGDFSSLNDSFSFNNFAIQKKSPELNVESNFSENLPIVQGIFIDKNINNLTNGKILNLEPNLGVVNKSYHIVPLMDKQKGINHYFNNFHDHLENILNNRPVVEPRIIREPIIIMMATRLPHDNLTNLRSSPRLQSQGPLAPPRTPASSSMGNRLSHVERSIWSRALISVTKRGQIVAAWFTNRNRRSRSNEMANTPSEFQETQASQRDVATQVSPRRRRWSHMFTRNRRSLSNDYSERTNTPSERDVSTRAARKRGAPSCNFENANFLTQVHSRESIMNNVEAEYRALRRANPHQEEVDMLIDTRFYTMVEFYTCLDLVNEVQQIILEFLSARFEYNENEAFVTPQERKRLLERLQPLQERLILLIRDHKIDIQKFFLKLVELRQLKDESGEENFLELTTGLNDQLRTSLERGLKKPTLVIRGQNPIFGKLISKKVPLLRPQTCHLYPRGAEGTLSGPNIIWMTLFEHLVATLLEMMQNQGQLELNLS